MPNEETILEPFIDEPEKNKKPGSEYISEGLSFSWGLDHGLFVDSKNRLFSTGFNRYGRLGHGDERDQSKFTLVKTMLNKKVIGAKCGYYHSLCVTKDGYLYSWGYGGGGRLG